ncbi:hypothetical protein C8J56DRAFT_884336 [Mycena floridula]|nr:hypothetical protein C8J56DRAFT_884336 [Mycena floridula]
MPSQPDPQGSSRSKQIAQSGRLTANILHDMTDATKSSYLNGPAGVGTMIFETLDNVKSNKEKCLIMTEQAYELLCAVINYFHQEFVALAMSQYFYLLYLRSFMAVKMSLTIYSMFCASIKQPEWLSWGQEVLERIVWLRLLSTILLNRPRVLGVDEGATEGGLEVNSQCLIYYKSGIYGFYTSGKGGIPKKETAEVIGRRRNLGTGNPTSASNVSISGAKFKSIVSRNIMPEQ